MTILPQIYANRTPEAKDALFQRMIEGPQPLSQDIEPDSDNDYIEDDRGVYRLKKQGVYKKPGSRTARGNRTKTFKKKKVSFENPPMKKAKRKLLNSPNESPAKKSRDSMANTSSASSSNRTPVKKPNRKRKTNKRTE